jgi:hypothetical protein
MKHKFGSDYGVVFLFSDRMRMSVMTELYTMILILHHSPVAGRVSQIEIDCPRH